MHFLSTQNNDHINSEQDTVQQDTRKISDFDTAAYISKNGFQEGEDAYARNAYNLKVSDKIPYDREVPEVRDPQ